MAAMLTASLRAHWGKPIWATQGGAELAVTYFVVALAVALAGPGVYSVDAALGIGVPRTVSVAAAVAAVLGVITAVVWRSERPPATRTAEHRDDRAA
jgi:putative oxidoreductase